MLDPVASAASVTTVVPTMVDFGLMVVSVTLGVMTVVMRVPDLVKTVVVGDPAVTFVRVSRGVITVVTRLPSIVNTMVVGSPGARTWVRFASRVRVIVIGPAPVGEIAEIVLVSVVNVPPNVVVKVRGGEAVQIDMVVPSWTVVVMYGASLVTQVETVPPTVKTCSTNETGRKPPTGIVMVWKEVEPPSVLRIVSTTGTTWVTGVPFTFSTIVVETGTTCVTPSLTIVCCRVCMIVATVPPTTDVDTNTNGVVSGAGVMTIGTCARRWNRAVTGAVIVG